MAAGLPGVNGVTVIGHAVEDGDAEKGTLQIQLQIITVKEKCMRMTSITTCRDVTYTTVHVSIFTFNVSGISRTIYIVTYVNKYM